MPTQRTIKLFFGTLVSATMLLFGLGTLAAMFLPALAGFVVSDSYQPQLPIARARTEAFLDVNSIPAKQLYPPLTEVPAFASADQINDMIHIPAIGVNVPIALSPSVNDADVLQTLDRGAALYPNGIEPGNLGNVFISAHSTGEPWKGAYRFSFLRINELEPGNIIHLDYDGARYTYRMTGKDIITPKPDFQVVSDRPQPTLTLMACWPLWTTSQRMLITAELTNITQLTPRALAASTTVPAGS